MAEERIGRQTPTQSLILPYTKTHGQETIEFYNKTKHTAMEWQELLIADIESYNDDGLWVHTKFGYELPRRNGKNEILTMREMSGLKRGEHVLHTAHLASTSHAAWERLYGRLKDAGVEITSSYRAKGSEHVEIEGGGRVEFRTRTSKGGLGEGYDTLIIDEAQEYTDDQESALKYIVSDSKNPQTIFCGTPPTTTSSGTVFVKMRERTLSGESVNTGWAEWSIEKETNIRNREAWYETNPSLGFHLTERDVVDEIGDDEVDFMIQRLGYWMKYNLKSAISKSEWEELKLRSIPKFKTKLYAGVKYGIDENVSLSIAAKTVDGRVFVEAIDCRPARAGNGWIIDFLKKADVKEVIVDGASGQQLLAADMKDAKLGHPIMPTVKEVIVANAAFEQAISAETICHMNQPSLTQSIGNCLKRSMGSNGGFGYKSLKDGIDISLLDSVMLAHWRASVAKEKKRQRVGY